MLVWLALGAVFVLVLVVLASRRKFAGAVGFRRARFYRGMTELNFGVCPGSVTLTAAVHPDGTDAPEIAQAIARSPPALNELGELVTRLPGALNTDVTVGYTC